VVFTIAGRRLALLVCALGSVFFWVGCTAPEFKFVSDAGPDVESPGDGAVISCRDQLTNGDETDIDCGGTICPACGADQRCRVQADCREGVCTNGVCRVPTCKDGVKNGTETDVDCGDVCAGCQTGKKCSTASDCQAQVCTNGVCQASSCGDQIANGSETDTDCGGAGCAKCQDGKKCLSETDCASGVCASDADGGGSQSCRAPSCNDGVFNGNETDLDCGGPGCAKCDTAER
jgi:hypothetical protein